MLYNDNNNGVSSVWAADQDLWILVSSYGITHMQRIQYARFHTNIILKRLIKPQ